MVGLSSFTSIVDAISMEGGVVSLAWAGAMVGLVGANWDGVNGTRGEEEGVAATEACELLGCHEAVRFRISAICCLLNLSATESRPFMAVSLPPAAPSVNQKYASA